MSREFYYFTHITCVCVSMLLGTTARMFEAIIVASSLTQTRVRRAKGINV